LIEEAKRGLICLQFSRHETLSQQCLRIANLQPVVLSTLQNGEFAKRANSVAGPGYISTRPACRSESSVNPPQSTPMIAIFAFPADCASSDVSSIRDGVNAFDPGFF